MRMTYGIALVSIFILIGASLFAYGMYIMCIISFIVSLMEIRDLLVYYFNNNTLILYDNA